MPNEWRAQGAFALLTRTYHGSRVIGMYGPPPHRKRNLRTPQVGLRKCIRPLLEWITPGQDGMRCALFSIMYGPPPHRKRNLRTPQVGLRKCIRPLLEWITPGQDGMRCALFSIN